MTTLILILTFAGFYALYNTSSRAELPQGSIEIWMRSLTILKPVGLVLLLVSLLLTGIYFGLAAGILYWFVIVSTIGSLIILLSPLKLMNYKMIILVFVGIFIAEIFIA